MTKKSFGEMIATAEVSQNGVWWLDGIYKIEIEAVKMITSRKEVACFIVEGTALESSNPERPIGTKGSWVVALNKDPAAGNIKAFFQAVTGRDDYTAEEWDELADDAISDDNPLQGYKVKLQVVTIQTKNNTPFSKHIWSSVEQ